MPIDSAASRSATSTITRVRSSRQDHKKLGRIPDGGGHRILGRTTETPRGRGMLGYDHFEVVIDDATRLAYVAHVPDESARSASGALLDAAILFAEHGVRIERILIDNA